MKRGATGLVLLMATVVTVAVAGQHPCAAQTYTVTDLGTLRTNNGGTSAARAISAGGVIVGFATNNSGVLHAFSRSESGVMTDLGSFNSAAFGSRANAINDADQVAGTSLTQPGGFASAFRGMAGGDLGQNLPELDGGGDSAGMAINAGGLVVGWSNRQIGCGGAFCISNPGQAVRWNGLNVIEVPMLGSVGGLATGINNDGFICGSSSLGTSPGPHAFRVPPGGSSADDLGTLGGTRSEAAAINNAAVVVGNADLASGVPHAARWLAGSTTAEDLGTLASRPSSTATAVSPTGLIVGFASNENTTLPRAVLFRPGTAPLDLNTMIPADSGWTLQAAYGVNDAGQVVGEGQLNGMARAFLLTPVPVCGADYNDDGVVNPDDLSDFINGYFANPPEPGADFNGDQTTNPDDLSDFINEFFGPNCV